MQVLKYLFFLLLLSIIASSIFVATQKGNFVIEKSKVINSPKSVVYNYVNDFKNWEDFSAWLTESPQTIIKYNQNTIGKGAAFTWEDKDGKGEMKTLSAKNNESILQEMNYDGTTSDIFWTFKDTVGGTKVTFKTTGKMGFAFKIYSTFNGGGKAIIGKMYKKSLDNLDKILDYESNTYSVKVNGLVKMLESFYLRQTFTSKISDIQMNKGVVFSKILDFCQKNNIETKGKPFLIYHTYDLTNKIAKLSFCIPIKREIYTSEGSDILSGKMASLQAVKTTLTGNYSHIGKAIEKLDAYFTANHFESNPNLFRIEIYAIGKNEIRNPSKWVTYIYYPLKPKPVVVQPPIITPGGESMTTPEVEEDNQPVY